MVWTTGRSLRVDHGEITAWCGHKAPGSVPTMGDTGGEDDHYLERVQTSPSHVNQETGQAEKGVSPPLLEPEGSPEQIPTEIRCVSRTFLIYFGFAKHRALLIHPMCPPFFFSFLKTGGWRDDSG